MRAVSPHRKQTDLPTPVSTQWDVHCKRAPPTAPPNAPAATADASGGRGEGLEGGAPPALQCANRRHSCASRTARLSQGRAASRSCPAPLTSSGTGQRAVAAAALRAEGTHRSQRRQHHPLGTLDRWWSLLSCRGMSTRPAEQVVLAKAVHLPVPRAVREHRVHSTVQLTGRAAGQLAISSDTGPNMGVRRCTPGGGPSSRTMRGTAGRLGGPVWPGKAPWACASWLSCAGQWGNRRRD